MFTRNGSYPAPLPHRLTLPNGFIRTDASTFTPEEIADAGYIEAPAQPAYDPVTERLEWTGTGWSVAAIPPAPLPLLTRRQLRLGLLSIGITAADVEAQINAIVDPTERAYGMIEWQDATQFRRDHPLIAQVAVALALPPEQVDDLWVWALGL